MTSKKHIHVVEDEEDIAKLIKYNLSVAGYTVTCSSSGEDGLAFVEKESVDLILLDLMLPGIDGLEICRQIKRNVELTSLPVIMLTAKGEEEDIVRGLEMGADDYISKPFSPKVLIARIKAVFRRLGVDTESQDNILISNELIIHIGKHEVLVDNKKVELTASEFAILLVLVRRKGWVFTRTQIVSAIRGHGYAVTDRTIDFQMVGLRKKIGSVADYIETVRGVGYRFKES